ncbi:MAG: transposase [Desulfobacterium sp.]|nr:transposase [Desulfobacterium sp.]
MSRKPRIHYPGAFYHLILRGNAKQPIFHGRDEIRYFEHILAQGLEEHSHRLYAFCWMNNHVHMALQAPNTPLSKMMQILSQRYTQWFNHRHDRVGHLFQGRYKAILIENNEYLLELIRYIHLNPVRAKLVTDPLDYKASSHGAYLNCQRAPPWLSIDLALKQFGGTEENAQASYLTFMGQPIDTDRQAQLRKGTTEGRILDRDNRTHKTMEKSDQPAGSNRTIEEIADLVAKEQGIATWELTTASRSRSITKARAIITLLALDHSQQTLADLARYFEREVPTMSRQVKNLRNRMKRDMVLLARIEKLITKMQDKRGQA